MQIRPAVDVCSQCLFILYVCPLLGHVRQRCIHILALPQEHIDRAEIICRYENRRFDLIYIIRFEQE